MSYRVLVVQPAFSGNAYVAHARSLGWDVLVASHESEGRTIAKPVRLAATELLTVDTNDIAALWETVNRANQLGKIDAVLAGGEFYVPAAAQLAARLEVPGLDPKVVDYVRNKPRMRQAVADAGLDVPKFAVVQGPGDLDEACAHIGFPAVFKPVECGGSIHVSRVDTVREARSAVAALHTEEDLEFGSRPNTDAIIEEYISGPEFSADGYVHNGEIIVAAVTKKLLGSEPHFLELGHITPASLEEVTQREITEYASGVVKAVGITTGPFHCELRLNSEGRPVLIEIAARLPGDRITDLLEMTTGLVLPRMVLSSATGFDPVSAAAFRKPDVAAAGIRFLTAGGSGSYTRLEGWEELTAEPWVVDSLVLIEPGAPVRTSEADYRSRIAAVVFTADSPAEAHERWQEIGDRVRVVSA